MSVWNYTVPKDVFRRKVKQGDISKDINAALDLMKEDRYSPRYPTATTKDKTQWLEDHVVSLIRGQEQIRREENETEKIKFLKDNFDVRESYKEFEGFSEMEQPTEDV